MKENQTERDEALSEFCGKIAARWGHDPPFPPLPPGQHRGLKRIFKDGFLSQRFQSKFSPLLRHEAKHGVGILIPPNAGKKTQIIYTNYTKQISSR